MAFKNLEKLRTSGTYKYTFDTIDLGAGPPWIEVRYGGKGTPGFRSDEIRIANAQRGRSDKLTEAVVDEGLRDDAHLIAQHCAVTWGNFLEDDGKPAPCTPEKVEEFLLGLVAVREDLFMHFRKNVRNAENFVDAPTAARNTSGTELGKS